MREFSNPMRHIKVLLVEDETIVALSLKKQLVDTFDLTVLRPVTRAEKAIEIAAAERPEVILMDIVLTSAMTGVEAARQIATIYNPLIIFASGYIDKKISDEIDSMNAYKLYKPYNIEDVMEIIKTMYPEVAKK